MNGERELVKFLYEKGIIDGEKFLFQCLRWLRDNKEFTKEDALELIGIVFKEK